MPGQESWGEWEREGERERERQVSPGWLWRGGGLRPKEGGVRTEEGRNCQSWAGCGSLVVGGVRRDRSLLSQAERGHRKQLSTPS